MSVIEVLDELVSTEVTPLRSIRIQEEKSIGNSHLYEVVDTLLEHDLLGLLLSTSHFQQYCKFKSVNFANEFRDFYTELGCNSDYASLFQKKALSKFNGLHIDACRFDTEHDLARHLEVKLHALFELNFARTLVQNSLEIQNAWKYRRATQGIRPQEGDTIG